MKSPQRPTPPARHSRQNEVAERPFFLRLARAIVRVLPLTLAAGLILSLIAAIIANSRPDPEPLLLPLALCISVIMSLLGGWLMFRSCRQACLWCGLTYGGALVLLFSITAWMLPAETSSAISTGIRWALRGGMILFSVFGAMMGSYAPRKKRKKKKRH